MGKEPHRLEDPASPADPGDLKRLESEIERSRRRLDVYVGELDRRRHRLLSVRKHPGAAVGIGLGAAALLGTAAVLVVRRRRTRPRRKRREAMRFRDALIRMARHPERVAAGGGTPWVRLLVAVAPILARSIAGAAAHHRAPEKRRRPRT